ncbi:MAG: methyltransferase domain-containing protein, partial [Bacteroidota bacterium]
MNCIICNSKKIKSISKMSREGFKIDLIQCSNCGHIYQPEEKFEEIYTTGKFTSDAREGTKTPSAQKIKNLDKRALKRYHYFKDLIGESKKVLEVGSSIGSFVHVLRLAGKSAEGLEPDPDYSSYSEGQYGFTQYQGLLENHKTTTQYNLICSFHVLEH